MIVVAPLLIGPLYAFLVSLLREPARRRFNAIMVAGAGAAYLSSGSFGPWEFVFTAAVTYSAYRGLDSYVWTGVAWPQSQNRNDPSTGLRIGAGVVFIRVPRQAPSRGPNL